jgi:hypothetical protein
MIIVDTHCTQAMWSSNSCPGSSQNRATRPRRLATPGTLDRTSYTGFTANFCVGSFHTVQVSRTSVDTTPVVAAVLEKQTWHMMRLTMGSSILDLAHASSRTSPDVRPDIAAMLEKPTSCMAQWTMGSSIIDLAHTSSRTLANARSVIAAVLEKTTSRMTRLTMESPIIDLTHRPSRTLADARRQTISCMMRLTMGLLILSDVEIL